MRDFAELACQMYGGGGSGGTGTGTFLMTIGIKRTGTPVNIYRAGKRKRLT